MWCILLLQTPERHLLLLLLLLLLLCYRIILDISNQSLPMSQLQHLSRLSGRRLSVSVEMNALMSDRTNDRTND
ncbi:hypothetical protein F4774DRAFT_390355 [Daldinia eschscholtzii]|nr:hypothetical protein F4774DRAFT_390355 [Daldinia eschscholtzii]